MSPTEIQRLDQWNTLFARAPKMAIAHAAWVSERLMRHEAEVHTKIIDLIRQVDAQALQITKLRRQNRQLKEKKTWRREKWRRST